MFKIQIVIETTSGKVFTGDVSSEEISEGDVEELETIICAFKKMNYFSITIDKNKTYFHPDHIVAIQLIRH